MGDISSHPISYTNWQLRCSKNGAYKSPDQSPEWEASGNNGEVKRAVVSRVSWCQDTESWWTSASERGPMPGRQANPAQSSRTHRQYTLIYAICL